MTKNYISNIIPEKMSKLNYDLKINWNDSLENYISCKFINLDKITELINNYIF